MEKWYKEITDLVREQTVIDIKNELASHRIEEKLYELDAQERKIENELKPLHQQAKKAQKEKCFGDWRALRLEIETKMGVASMVKNKLEELCQELPMDPGDITDKVAAIIKKYNKHN